MRWLLVLLVACAPVVDGPADRQRGLDRGDGDRLAAQLAALPGVVTSEVVIRRPVRDPLDVAVAPPPTASLVVIVDDAADRAAIARAARQLATTAAPGSEPVVIVEVGAVRPVLATLGPFTVEARSKRPLQVALAIAFAAIALLAGGIAWRTRPRGELG